VNSLTIAHLCWQVLSWFSRLVIFRNVALVVLEPDAVAVHVEGVNVAGESIEQGAGQAFRREHAGLLGVLPKLTRIVGRVRS
jgi:hypothetical protein